MSIIQIEPVQLQGLRYIINLFGLSETGKTLSALLLAAGMEPNPAKRGLMDSEGGQRGRFYMKDIPGGYLYGQLTPPFTPERYNLALQAFVAKGVTTLVIDSSSHAWFAAGGILDMAEQSSATGQAKWAEPKRRLTIMTQGWHQCGIHLILCSRAKRPLVPGPIVKGKPTMVPGPVVPVQEKNLRYDMTVMAQMLGRGKFSVALEDGGKCPGVLLPIFASSPLMNQEMGRKLMEFIGGQTEEKASDRLFRIQAHEVAAKGVEALREWWEAQAKVDQYFLKDSLANLKDIAASADAELERRRKEAEALAAEEDLSEPFGPEHTDDAPLPDGIEHAEGQGDLLNVT